MAGILWISALSLGLGSLARNTSLQVSLPPQSWELAVSHTNTHAACITDLLLVTRQTWCVPCADDAHAELLNVH